jgi:hypothetical protein
MERLLDEAKRKRIDALVGRKNDFLVWQIRKQVLVTTKASHFH